MAVSINQTQRPQWNQESDLDKLAKLIQIGGSAATIYDAYKGAPLKDAQAQLAQNQVQEQNDKLAMQRRLDAGNVDKADLLPLGKEYSISDSPLANSVRVQVNPSQAQLDQGPQQPLYKYITQKRDEMQPYNIAKIQSEANKNNAEAKKFLTEANSPKKQFDNLPKEAQVGIEKVAGRQATQLSIANSIDSTVGVLSDPSIPEDQKLMQGRQLIKVLNSQEGQDAVGAEEAKRLAAKLEYSYGNFTNSNPMQFGRDLPGFKEQAQITANSLRQSAKANNDLIAQMKTGSVNFDKKYNVGSAPKEAPYQLVNGAKVFNTPQANASAPHPQDAQAVQWAKQNLGKDPRAEQILKANGAQINGGI